MTLYLDDSGTRKPDRAPADVLPKHGHDWFALGGVLIRDEDQSAFRRVFAEFQQNWGIHYPLHSSEIRKTTKQFKWLKDDAERCSQFHSALSALVTSRALVATACVIDRPGYNARYLSCYGPERWLLCKTAFNVVVERAAKFARRHECRLRVYVEGSDQATDRRIEKYYQDLRTQGSPFSSDSSAKYAPLTQGELFQTLYEFRIKNKSSPLMQVADIALYPLCLGGYEPSYRAFLALKNAGTIIDLRVPPEAVASEGIKYSCWEIERTKHQSPVNDSPGFGTAVQDDLIG